MSWSRICSTTSRRRRSGDHTTTASSPAPPCASSSSKSECDSASRKIASLEWTTSRDDADASLSKDCIAGCSSNAATVIWCRQDSFKTSSAAVQSCSCKVISRTVWLSSSATTKQRRVARSVLRRMCGLPKQMRESMGLVANMCPMWTNPSGCMFSATSSTGNLSICSTILPIHWRRCSGVRSYAEPCGCSSNCGDHPSAPPYQALDCWGMLAKAAQLGSTM
mmetsp:Transcript_119225/g.337252  ORF Transcript_119225/g.337252 Transcript_119225/m.337252 type:complete len:222 (-) Transcript_119225:648-1313(-)